MKKLLAKAFSATLLTLISGCASTPLQPTPWIGKPTVILISLDGFRTEYLSRGLTPHLLELARNGVSAEGMRPSFPSITFPNHYTLVTGLRPDHHGIVGNTMYDADHPGIKFTMQSKDSYWWNEAEPIWVTAKQHGLNVGTLFWPGSEAIIHNMRPDEWLPFRSQMSDSERVHTLLSWYDAQPAKRPEFSTLYFNIVDTQGHHFGPDSIEVEAALEDVDDGIGQLIEGLKKRHIPADIIVVADHGMASVGENHIIPMDQIAPASSYHWITGGAYAGVNAVPGKTAVLEKALLQSHSHMTCWRKAEIPERFHYGKNPRVPAYICLADVGWMIQATTPDKSQNPYKGAHGYDPAAPQMSAVFVANGPDFKAGKVLPPFDNVDVYSLVTHLLDIPAQPNDGTLKTFLPVLNTP
ncbi:ectonucleotide pyrophosphatase/phosphodiesterase [Gluconobacter sp. OJA]|uniref:alkaline phosphatase family protein n=1 Tax=Gluconobacter sp. OJA TaxID=3145197 RepID=UPI0031F76877